MVDATVYRRLYLQDIEERIKASLLDDNDTMLQSMMGLRPGA